jgi:myo-inositol-1(or 4)-monophosphatase
MRLDTVLTEALYAAGELLRGVQATVRELGSKGHQDSVVTDADLESERRIIQIIQRHFPLHGIVGEEGGNLGQETEYMWVVDPLDGTSNFAAGLPLFGVSICVLKDRVPVVGGTYLPALDELFVATRGHGAAAKTPHHAMCFRR